MKQRLPILAPLAFTLLTGCSHAPEPFRVRASELPTLRPVDLGERPLIVEFREGDRIPIDLAFTGELVELVPASPTLEFRVRRPFFVRVTRDGLAISTDGVHFGERPRAPGSFAFGLQITRAGARVDVKLRTPQHALPDVERR